MPCSQESWRREVLLKTYAVRSQKQNCKHGAAEDAENRVSEQARSEKLRNCAEDNYFGAVRCSFHPLWNELR